MKYTGRFSITANPNGGFTYRFIEEPIEAESAKKSSKKTTKE